jgi:hypothetical protein
MRQTEWFPEDIHEHAELIKNKRFDDGSSEANRNRFPNSNKSIKGYEKGFDETFTNDLSSSCHQAVIKSRGYGDLSEPFDEYMQNNPEPHKKAEVAKICGTDYWDRAFVNLVYRRVHIDKTVKVLPGGDKIVWVNRDWQNFEVSPDVAKRPYLNLLLPFGAEKLIATPEKTQIVVAGDGGGGKTHFGYHTADLNLGKRSIRHFVVEDGDQRMVKLLDDFPALKEAYLAHDGRYHLINPSKGEGLDVAENLDPDGLNIYDYARIPDRKDWYLAVQREMIRLSDNLETGAVMVMVQKKGGQPIGYGGDFSKMQCEAYFSLHIDRNVRESPTDYGHKECHVNIEKARDYASKQIPETMACGYRTAPLHGKLVPDTQGWITRENFES